MQIDVTIATKNNESTIARVLEAIKKNIPYNNIIVVDDSTDSTPEIAKKLGAQVHRAEGYLGLKRFMQAKLAQTEWIASIDSDIFVYENWWPEMSKYMRDPSVALISGYLESSLRAFFPEYECYTKFCSRVRSLLVRRSGTIGCVLIRREALLLCENELRGVHAGEDTIIGKVLKSKGFTFRIVRTPVGNHFHADEIAHQIMAYIRAGQSAGMNRSCISRILHGLRFVALTYMQLILFCLVHKKISLKLWRVVSLLAFLYISGVANITRFNGLIKSQINKIIHTTK